MSALPVAFLPRRFGTLVALAPDPCAGCGPACEHFPCENADPEGPVEIGAALAAKE